MLYGLKKITVFLYRCLTLLNRAVRGPDENAKNFDVLSRLISHFFPNNPVSTHTFNSFSFCCLPRKGGLSDTMPNTVVVMSEQ